MCGLGPNNCGFFLFVLYLLLLGFLLISLLTLCVFADVKLEGDVNCQLVDQTRFNLSSPDQSVTVGRFFSLRETKIIITVLLWTIHVFVFVWYVCEFTYIIWSLPTSLLAYIITCIKQLQICMSYICVPVPSTNISILEKKITGWVEDESRTLLVFSNY